MGHGTVTKIMTTAKPDSVVLTPEELAARTAAALKFGRMLLGILPAGERGKQVFKPVVNFYKNPDRVCALESHFENGSCARELVGYLEAEHERLVEEGLGRA